MKTLNTWLSEYAVSHQNPTNRLIHTFCVPAIFFSILAFTWCFSVFNFRVTYILMILVAPFYLRLGAKATLILGAQLLVSVGVLLFLPVTRNQLMYGAIALFVVAWIGQFIGHKIEGQKPSFFEDLQFLLIGPLWVFLK